MTSYNELRKQIAIAIKPTLDAESSVAQGSGGDLYVRIRDQVFKIDIQEIENFDNVADPIAATAQFMETLPYKY